MRRHEIDRVVAPAGKCLAGHGQAQPHIIRQHVVAGDQHGHFLGRDRYELGRNDPGVGDAGHHRLEAVEVAAKVGEADVGRRHFIFLQDRVDQQVGQRAGRGHRHGLAFQVFDLLDARAHHQPMRHARPVAADNLQVGAVRAGQDRRAGARFDAVELARQQRLVRGGAVLQADDIELEAVLFGKAPAADHQHEAGIALGFDHGVPPGLEVGRSGRAANDRQQQRHCEAGKSHSSADHAAMIGGFASDING